VEVDRNTELKQDQKIKQVQRIISQILSVFRQEPDQKLGPLTTLNISIHDPFTLKLDQELTTIKGSIAIVAQTGMLIRPDLIKQGKCGAGSELALLEFSVALANSGYAVRVFTNINHRLDQYWTLPCQNPRFLPIDKSGSFGMYPCGPEYLNCLTDFTVQEIPIFERVIVWRAPDKPDYCYRALGRRVAHWSHDLPSQQPYTDIDAVFALSDYHARLWSKKVPPRIKIMKGCNGLSTSLINEKTKSKRIAHKCIYASNYGRGLAYLLSIWPEVRRVIPDATLDIYYGRETWGTLAQPELAKIIIQIEQDDSITEHGMVPHDQLCAAFESGSVLAYPCTSLTETFCIVAGIAQAKGCIPVTTRLGALAETVHPNYSVYLEDYQQKLIETLEQEDKIDRTIFPQHVKNYTWQDCVKAWGDGW